MNRGANRQVVFLDDQDREMFLVVVEEAVTRFGIEVHAYCLMPNHYHLLMRSPETQLSRAMKHIGQVYTQRFNRRHGRDGSLFRGRFHSILVDSDNYLIHVAKYIHLNPVNDECPDLTVLDDFTWSSLPVYEGAARRPTWLTISVVRGRFSTAAVYGEHVRLRSGDRPLRKFYRSPFDQRKILGDQRFVRLVNSSIGRAIDEERAGIGPPSSEPDEGDGKPEPGV